MDENNGMVMPVSPYGGNGNSMFGGGELAWIILFIALFAGGGWGNSGANGAGGLYPWLSQSNQINDGFRDQMLGSAVTGIQSSVINGFSAAQNAMCSGFAGVQNGFAQAEISENARQLAYLQQMSAIQAQLAQCFHNTVGTYAA